MTAKPPSLVPRSEVHTASPSKSCLAVVLVALLLAAAVVPAAEVTTGTLLEEMGDLARLARWPEPRYRTLQFSSHDRRSTAPALSALASTSSANGSRC